MVRSTTKKLRALNRSTSRIERGRLRKNLRNVGVSRFLSDEIERKAIAAEHAPSTHAASKNGTIFG